ncbi:hypothetical protein BGW80DRAFT_1306745 [Lactifluus volemus]|nr:hypothetical protein BGW80DRAFT_1306745 [Lactifluus volemus]
MRGTLHFAIIARWVSVRRFRHHIMQLIFFGLDLLHGRKILFLLLCMTTEMNNRARTVHNRSASVFEFTPG